MEPQVESYNEWTVHIRLPRTTISPSQKFSFLSAAITSGRFSSAVVPDHTVLGRTASNRFEDNSSGDGEAGKAKPSLRGAEPSMSNRCQFKSPTNLCCRFWK